MERTSLQEQLNNERQSKFALEELLNSERREKQALAQLEKATGSEHHVTGSEDPVTGSAGHMTPPLIVRQRLIETDDPIKSPIVRHIHQQTTPTVTPLYSTPTKTLARQLQPKDHSHLLLSEKYHSTIAKTTKDVPYRGYSDGKSPLRSKVKKEGKSLSEEGKSLPEEALVGLKQAFDLINTLSSINVQLQEEVTRLTQENLVSGWGLQTRPYCELGVANIALCKTFLMMCFDPCSETGQFNGRTKGCVLQN